MAMAVSDKKNEKKVKEDFPLLWRQMNGQPLVYLDNAATTQKPLSVINRITEFYKNEYATVHRGVYALSQDSTIECELVRDKCRGFLNASMKEEIVFVRGATEAINLVVSTYGEEHVGAGDEVIITTIEHHANLVPWQQLCERKKAILQVVPVNDRGELDMTAYEKLLSNKTKIVAVGHVSNALGTINPVEEITQLAHTVGAKVLIDGAQAVPHLSVDVQKINCDFYVFSSHKVYGPTGIGVLFGKKAILEKMKPYQYGGDMIESVRFEKTTFAQVPQKFEAGTPAIAEIVGLGAAITYLELLGYEWIQRHEGDLLAYGTQQLQKVKDLRIIGTAKNKASVISFVLGHIHAHDIGSILDQCGIAIRAGHHCAQPTMKRFGVPATVRASFAVYNTHEDIDKLIQGLKRVQEVFA